MRSNKRVFAFMALVLLTRCTEQLPSSPESNDREKTEPAADETAQLNGETQPTATGASFAVSLATDLGGSGEDMIRDVVTDAQGNIYITGGTASGNFPVTAGAFDATFNNPGSTNQDVFVTKLSRTGQVIWSTFIGGPGYDRAYAMEIDAQGFVYVAGRAGRGMRVTANAVQRQFAGGIATGYGEQDGFVCKLQPNGAALVFCTYFGNRDTGVIRDITLDAASNVYLVTSVATDTFPRQWFTGRYQASRRGGRDVLIAKLDASGSRVHWATYLGGSSDELNTSTVRLDANQNVYVLLNTLSGNMPVLNGFDRTLGGRSDLYLAKLSPDGARLLFGTYVGGSNQEGSETHQLWLSPAGEAVVTGVTTSTDFPTTIGAYQRTYGGTGSTGTGSGTNYNGDGFIAKISPAGALTAATYFGGTRGDGIEGVGVAGGNIYVSGTTFSDVFPTTIPRVGPGGGADVFAAVFTADLRTLVFSARIGGRAEETSRSAFVDAMGSGFLIGGITLSTDFPFRNASPSLHGSGEDGALIKIQPGS